MDHKFKRIGEGGRIMVPTNYRVSEAELYKLRSEIKRSKRANIMEAQDDAALRYQILTGDVIK